MTIQETNLHDRSKIIVQYYDIWTLFGNFGSLNTHCKTNISLHHDEIANHVIRYKQRKTRQAKTRSIIPLTKTITAFQDTVYRCHDKTKEFNNTRKVCRRNCRVLFSKVCNLSSGPNPNTSSRWKTKPRVMREHH